MAAQMEIDKALYHQFLADWNKGKFFGQRFGQAFYNFFNLHKLSDQSRLDNLYNVIDKNEAHRIIGENFRIQ